MNRINLEERPNNTCGIVLAKEMCRTDMLLFSAIEFVMYGIHYRLMLRMHPLWTNSFKKHVTKFSLDRLAIKWALLGLSVIERTLYYVFSNPANSVAFKFIFTDIIDFILCWHALLDLCVRYNLYFAQSVFYYFWGGILVVGYSSIC